MKSYPPDKIKNIVMIGHAGSGKTSITETFAFNSGVITRVGNIVEGNTISDHDSDEIKRHQSIKNCVVPIEYNGYKMNIVDAPGFADFIGEKICGISACDSAIFVACAVSGLGVGATEVWELAESYKLPRIIFMNRLDKERADFDATFSTLRETFGKDVIAIHIPIGKEASFSGMVDVLNKTAYRFENGKKVEIPIPEDMKDQLQKYRDILIEEVVEIDEELLAKFMNNEEITDEQVFKAFQKSVDHDQVYPVLCGSATKNIGISTLMEAAEYWLPGADEKILEGIDGIKKKAANEESFSGYVFATMIEPHVGEMSYVRVLSGVMNHSSAVYNSSKGCDERIGQIFFTRGKQREETQTAQTGDIVAVPKLKGTATGDTLCDKNKQIVYRSPKFPEPIYSIAVKPKSKADQEKMGTALNALTHEDLTFKVTHNLETRETIISGMGDIHLEVILEKQKKRYGVDIEAGAPRIPYRETIKGRAKTQGKYKKQSGGRGQYGDTWLELEPLPRGGGFQFTDKIVGGAIPKNYIPAVEKGIKDTLHSGVIAGYPVMDVKVTLYDGSYHEVDSSDMAFKIAASMGFKKGFAEARPIILEPIMDLDVNIPDDCVGDIVSDLNKKRGKIHGMDQGTAKHQIVKAAVPFAEIAKYASDLRSISRGRGYFSVKFSHYEEVPAKTQAELVAAYEQLKAAGELEVRT